jgi:hypothetical protein
MPKAKQQPIQQVQGATLAEGAVGSAERAERAAERTAVAAAQVAALVERLTSGSGKLPVESSAAPNGIEIRVGEAAQSPLTRAADALARAVSAVGGAVHDYSGGRYGLEPVNAKELRHERKKERDQARPVAIIEERHASGAAKGRGRTPIIAVILGVVAGATALAIWQRRRLQAAASQAMRLGQRTAQQVQQQVASQNARLREARPAGDSDLTAVPTSAGVAGCQPASGEAAPSAEPTIAPGAQSPSDGQRRADEAATSPT